VLYSANQLFHARIANTFSHSFSYLSPRLGICGFVSLFSQNKFEDLYECNFYKMIRKIKLQLICIIEHMLFFIVEFPTTKCIWNNFLKQTMSTFPTLNLQLYGNIYWFHWTLHEKGLFCSTLQESKSCKTYNCRFKVGNVDIVCFKKLFHIHFVVGIWMINQPIVMKQHVL
jgi:hypothetical protein